MKAARSVVAGVLVLSLSAVAAPQRASRGGSSDAGPLSLSGAIGPAFLLDPGALGVRITARGAYELQLVQKLSVQLGLGLGFLPTFRNNTTLMGFDLFPFGKALFSLMPELSGFFELGLGPTFGSATSTTVLGQTFTVSSTTTHYTVMIGATYRL